MTTRSRTDWRKEAIRSQEHRRASRRRLSHTQTPARFWTGVRLSRKLLNSKSPRRCLTYNQQPMTALLSWSHFRRRSANDLGGIEHRVRSQVRRFRREQLLFAINQIGCIEGRQFESVA